MDETEPPPMILCMENIDGEEVALRIEHKDDFQTFLDKAKALLGFDVDLNSVTRNEPVALTDNIYQFFLKSENNVNSDLGLTTQTLEQILDPNDGSNDLVYILDDGTQINASQIHFDNEDAPLDLSVENIPFVKYADVDSEEEDTSDRQVRKYNIIESPIPKWTSKGTGPKSSFANSLPFKLVCNNASAFEAQYAKYLQNSNQKNAQALNNVPRKSPRSLLKEDMKAYQNYQNSRNFNTFSREDVLNMFKDSPVVSMRYENVLEKRKHVRKTDPTSSVLKKHDSLKPMSFIEDGAILGRNENSICFICSKHVDDNLDKMYLFDNEDQKVHRTAMKRQSTQLKIICESCLNVNFKPSRHKNPNQPLSTDEFLVIRNNQQYIFQKTNSLILNSNRALQPNVPEKEMIKIDIALDGTITSEGLDLPFISKDETAKEAEMKSSSDVEIIEPGDEIDDNIIDNLDDAEEHVKEFLGKYQDVEQDCELKCRFCQQIFKDLQEVVDHGSKHKHDIENEEVYPCPLCDYGYANFKWLKCHLRAAHDKALKTEKGSPERDDETQKDKGASGTENDSLDSNKDKDHISLDGYPSPKASPVATRTRNSKKKDPSDNDKSPHESEVDKPTSEVQDSIGKNISENGQLLIKTEVKQETLDTSDEEAIWIVQTAEDDLNEEQIRDLFEAKVKEAKQSGSNEHHCTNCRGIFNSDQLLAVHKCGRRRGKKRKYGTGNTGSVEFQKPRKRNGAEPSSDPQIVTCNDCNESFTSKVRLKFHMQFHSANSLLVKSGQYSCPDCPAVLSTESELFDHVHFSHHKQQRWHCGVRGCGKTFYLRANLTKHSRIHTDTRRYVCPTCGKRFLDKQTLDEHGVTHLQIKPYQCHVCLKQLTRRSRLRMHLRAHEEEVCPRRVPVCGQCRRAFKDGDSAQEHAKTSLPCIEQFASELKKEVEELQLSPTSGLVRGVAEGGGEEQPPSSRRLKHEVCDAASEELLRGMSDEARSLIRVVEIEKAFRCEFCEDVFYLEESLNEHRQVHKGVKNPFTCHICKVSFATYSRCTTHKTTHGYYKRSLEHAKRSPGLPPAGPSSTGILGYGGFPVAKHFLCEDCGRSYLHWTYLQVHRRMKHAGDNYLYTCKLCNISFPNSSSISYHKKKVHSKDANDDGLTAKVPRHDYRIPCRDCDEVLPNKTALYKHRKNNHSDMSLRINSKAVSWNANVRNSSNLNNYHRTRSLHPSRARTGGNVLVLEMPGTNPSQEEIMNALAVHKIKQDQVLDISKISFVKGTSTIVPCTGRALALVGLHQHDRRERRETRRWQLTAVTNEKQSAARRFAHCNVKPYYNVIWRSQGQSVRLTCG